MAARIAHPYSDRGLDLYETPPCAVKALVRSEFLPFRIWEPAAGRGAIVKALRESDHEVIASDIIERDFELDFVGDFLKMDKAPAGVEAICTNPPYRLGTQFVEHALRLVPRVFMLCRLSFVSSRRRSIIMDGGKLVAVRPFIERLPMLHRDGWTGPRATSMVDYAWFIWWTDHPGDTKLQRISIYDTPFPSIEERD